MLKISYVDNSAEIFHLDEEQKAHLDQILTSNEDQKVSTGDKKNYLKSFLKAQNSQKSVPSNNDSKNKKRKPKLKGGMAVIS